MKPENKWMLFFAEVHPNENLKAEVIGSQ